MNVGGKRRQEGARGNVCVILDKMTREDSLRRGYLGKDLKDISVVYEGILLYFFLC